jgi:uncharacterized protein
MRSTLLVDGPAPVHLLILEDGDEVVTTLTGFARDRGIGAAEFTAIGAVSDAEFGWFDAVAKQYRPRRLDQQCEVVSLIGDVAVADDGPMLHAHIGLGAEDGTLHGGHLMSAHVHPTLEVKLRVFPVVLRREQREDLGTAVIVPPDTEPAGGLKSG